MTSVTFDVALGGDGSTVSDDNSPTTGLGADGHRTRLLPMLQQQLAVANFAKTKAAEAVQSVLDAQAWATSAVNSPGTSATSTTSITLGTGAKTCTVQTGKNFVVGQYITVSRTSAPATAYMDAKITSYNSGTGALGFEVLKATGTGSFTDWTIGLAGAPTSAGSTGSTSTTLTARQQLTLTSASTQVQRLIAPGFGCALVLPAGNGGSPKGSDIVCAFNDGEYPIGVLDNTLQVIGQILPGENVDFHLTDNTTQAGSWAYSHNLDPWWTVSEVGANIYNNMSIQKIDENRSLVHYTNISNYPCVRYLAHPADGSMTIGSEYVIYAGTGYTYNASESFIGSNNRALIGLGSQRFVVLDFSAGPTLSVGTSFLNGLTVHSKVVAFGDGQHFLMIGYNTVGFQLEGRVYSIGTSGTAVTMDGVSTGAVGSWSTGAPQNVFLHVIDTTTIGYFALVSNGSYYSTVFRSITRGGAGGVSITWGAVAAQPASLNTSDLNQNNSYPPQQVSGNVFLWQYRVTGSPYFRYATMTFATACAFNNTVASTISHNSSSPSVKLVKLSASAWLALANVNGGSNTLEVVQVSGTTPTISNLTSIDATNAAAHFPSESLNSAIDGRGVLSYTGTGSKPHLRGYAWNGTTLSLGTIMYPSSNGNQNAMNVTSFGRPVTEAGGTVMRFASVFQYQNSASADYTAAVVNVAIDASGNVTYGGFSKAYDGQTASPIGFEANKAYFSTASQGFVTHGVVLNGKFKMGRGPFKFPQGIDIALTGGGLSKLEFDHRPDRTGSIARVRFAGV